MNLILKIVGCLFFGAGILAQPLLAQTKQPNIIYLLVDDLGFSDCGFNGGKDIQTPNIDGLAKNGTILQHFYVQPVCSPSRAALLTGRYPTHTGIYSVIKPGANYGLPLNEKTLAQSLKEIGYSTAMVGKWHLGDVSTSYLPNARGFDIQYGHYSGNIDYFKHTRNNEPDWFRNGIPLQEEGYSTHLIGKEACSILEKASKNKPLFLYVSFNGIHQPLQVPASYMNPYPDLSGDRKILAGMLSAVDEAIGEIVKTLEKTGLIENSLIVFSSDNGGPPPGNNAPLRDYKGSLYEGGIRGAAFVYWPGKVPAGIKVTEPLHIVDWYPTFLQLAGGKTEQALPLDGINCWPVITQNAKSPHEALLSVSTKGPSLAALRMGEWKLILDQSSDSSDNSTNKSGKKKKYEAEALYHLTEDPSETTNRAILEPERLAEMKKKLLLLLKDANTNSYFR